MADYPNPAGRFGSTARTEATAGVIDEGLRAHMLRVYNYMVIGLAMTGLFAIGTFMLATSGTPNPDYVGGAQVGESLYLTGIGAALYTGPLMWVVFLAPLGLVFFLSFRIAHMSVTAAQTTFWIFAALLGGEAIVERIFAWDGIGTWALQGILRLDVPVVQGMVLVAGAITLVTYTLLDIIVGLLDPRITHG